MAEKSSLQFYALLFLSLMLINGSQASGCIKAEHDALLTFKANLIDQEKSLSSWNKSSNDCCQWVGVHCDKKTGHIIHLNLSSQSLQGNLTPSLLTLNHLQYLDLSLNCFNSNPIPKFIGSFKHLVYLNLGVSCFAGIIPSELGNLTRLQFLDLTTNTYDTMLDDASWLSHLTSLRYLAINGIRLTGVTNFMQSLNNLPHLEEIYLRQCSMDSLPQSFPDINFTSLTIMEIGDNNLDNTSIPDWLFRIPKLSFLEMEICGFIGTIPPSIGSATNLEFLDLYGNMNMFGDIPRELGDLCNLQVLYFGGYTFSGQSLEEFGEAFSGCIKNSLSVLSVHGSWMTGLMPNWLGDLKNLTKLDLSENYFYGSIPESLGRLSWLKVLDLSDNHLNGTIPSSIGRLSWLQTLNLELNYLNGIVPESLGQLSELENLDLSGNNFNFSIITEAHLAKLTSLKELNLREAYLVLNMSSNWLPGFQANIIDLRSCYVGPKFPEWLANQVNLSTLMMSSTGIKDSMPDWFWNITYTITLLDLTYNEISGMMPPHLKFQPHLQGVTLLLGFNLFEGSVPYFPPNVAALDLTNNSLSGAIPSDLGDMNTSELFLLSFSSNNLDGGIPNSLCNFMNLAILDLSNNHLAGEIPDCWNNSQTLGYFNLAINMLEGGLPDSIGSLQSLQVLDVSINNLHGEFPSFLNNSTSLITLNLGHNKFTGNIPIWIEVMTSLMIINLRSNDLLGDLPPLLNLTMLHFLDLSHNHFSGSIPQSYGNFTGMINVTQNGGASFQHQWAFFIMNMSVPIKGANFQFGNLLSVLRFMDLSSNHLSGQIPDEIVNLIGLQSLDLSENHLTGKIPTNIGLMQSLESLDLSRNSITGTIPPSLSTLNFLGYLNLSYNNLNGQIPFIDHLTTFNDPSIYAGNVNLCGPPLNKNCTVIGNGENEDQEDEGKDGVFWICIGMIPGFLVGFWTVFGILMFNKVWRYAYFRFVDYMFDMIYVMVAVNKCKFKRNLVKMKLRLREALFTTNQQ